MLGDQGAEVTKRPVSWPGGSPTSHACSNQLDSLSRDSESSIEATLKEVIGISSHKRMDALCQHFIASGDYQDIYHTLSLVEGLYKRVRNLASYNELLGGSDISESSISRAIRTIIKVLEDLLLNAMEGNDISKLARDGLLLYQAASDVRL